jgi:hypothetical protein
MAKGTVERSFENLFDGLFSRAFKSGVKPLQLGRRLVQVVDSERDVDAQGRRVVPNSYLVQLSPADREGFADIEPTLVQELTAALREYITQEGYHVEGKARVALRTNPDLRKGKFDINARNIAPDGAQPASSDAVLPDQNVEQQVTAPVSPPVLSMVPGVGVDVAPAVLTLPSGQRIELHEGHYVLGRHLENDIVVNDTNVSRKHAEFVCAAGEVVVRDLGSTNGTKVNGVAITGEQLLQHGDIINLGTAQITFEAS